MKRVIKSDSTLFDGFSDDPFLELEHLIDKAEDAACALSRRFRSTHDPAIETVMQDIASQLAQNKSRIRTTRQLYFRK